LVSYSVLRYFYKKKVNFEILRPRVAKIIESRQLSVKERLTKICELLQSSLPAYDWVGFYFADDQEKMLHLKAFAGEPTDHTVIPFGKGICGQVAESNSNFVVPDVKAQNNYIACSIYVKAEIVIPLFKDGKNIGQIDIDSHTPDPFTGEDERFLEWVNTQVATML
jgi:L-methionine (R)-S-oxide reductase